MSSSPIWALSIPAGFALTLGMRFLSLGLQIKSGVPLKNVSPREQLESKELAMKDTDGYVRRAYAAHQNSWEAMILWGSAVYLARTAGVEERAMNTLATSFLATRLVYVAAYVIIKEEKYSCIRTVVWAVGTATSFRLMYIATVKA